MMLLWIWEKKLKRGKKREKEGKETKASKNLFRFPSTKEFCEMVSIKLKIKESKFELLIIEIKEYLKVNLQNK